MIALPFRSTLKPVGRAMFAKTVKKSAFCSEFVCCLIVTKPVAVFLLYVTMVTLLKLASNITAQNSS